MFAQCCENDWLCPVTNHEPEFSDESRAKPFTANDKHSMSTGLHDGSTTSPQSNQSNLSYPLDRFSTHTVAGPVCRSRQPELELLNNLIDSRQRSCSMLRFECHRR